MIAKLMSWSLTYLMHSTLLIAAIWIATKWIRSAAVRDALWKLALVGGIVTATLQMAIPSERATNARVWNTTVTTTPIVATPTVETPVTATPVVATTPSLPAIDRTTMLAIGWSAIALLLLGRIAYGRKQLSRILLTRREVVLGEDRALIDDVAEAARCERLVRLTQSDGIASPIAMLGWEIVVPGEMFASLTDEQRRTILAHELAHLQRRDPLWLVVAESIKALLFFQPLNRLATMKMKETAEFLCDDAAVLQTGDRRALAETLAALAAKMSPMPSPVAAMAEGGSHLIERVTRVLRAHGAPDLPLKMRWRIAGAFVPLALIALFAPGVAPARLASRISEVIQPDASGGDVMENHFIDGVLEHTYVGPEGKTIISMDAKNVRISRDGRTVEFDNAKGFLRATYTAERGPERRVDATPGRGLAPQFTYRVGGVEKPWCDDAQRLMIASVLYKELEDIPIGRASAKNPNVSEWNANVEETGHRDGVPVTIRITIRSLYFDRVTSKIDLARGASIAIEERLGEEKRRFEFENGEPRLIGDFDGMDLDQRRDWAAGILRRHTTGDVALVDAVRSLVP